jgi:nitrogen regulatory protein PII
MKPVKRIEIIGHAQDLSAITGILDQLGLTTYAIIRDVVGRDDRGHRLTDDELTGVMKHSCLVTCCDPEQLSAVTDAIRPVLIRRGGTCLVSDAHWLLH